MTNYAIILASGNGTRFGSKRPKQFIKVGKRMVIEHTLDIFQQSDVIDHIILVSPEKYIPELAMLKKTFPKIQSIVAGGTTRKQSCINGVSAILEDDAKVFIHNGVQPLLSQDTLRLCAEALDQYDSVSVGSPSVYTVLHLNPDRTLKAIYDREYTVNDLGPECFNLSFLRSVLKHPDEDCTNITGLVFRYKMGKTYIVPSNSDNIKITYPHDISIVKSLIQQRKNNGR